MGVWVPLGTIPTHVRKATMPEWSPTYKKAGVCAITSIWLVHIKEHVWTIRTCPTTIFLPDCRIIGGAIRQMQKYCAFPQVVVLQQKCAYSCHVTCMLPWELIWEEVAPSHKRMKHWKALHTWICGETLNQENKNINIDIDLYRNGT